MQQKKPLKVKDARKIAEKTGYQEVLIFGIDVHTGDLRGVTYGTNKFYKQQVQSLGVYLMKGIYRYFALKPKKNGNHQNK